MNADHTKYEKVELVTKYVEKLKSISEVASKKFEALLAEINEALPIKQDNLAGETDRNITLYHKYVTRLTEEKRQYNVLKNKRAEMEGEIQDYYRHHWDKSTKLTESAVNRYTEAHPVYMAINNLTEDQKAFVDHLDHVVSDIRDRGFAIKNLIELRKMELGLN